MTLDDGWFPGSVYFKDKKERLQTERNGVQGVHGLPIRLLLAGYDAYIQDSQLKV